MAELIVLLNGIAVFDSVRTAYLHGFNTEDVSPYDSDVMPNHSDAFEQGRFDQQCG